MAIAEFTYAEMV